MYSKNIGALKKKSEILVTWVEENKDKDSEWIIPFNNSDGMQNFYIRNTSGNLPAYSPENLAEEIEKSLKDVTFHKEDLSIVMGIGAGHVISAIIKKRDEGHRILVIEPVAKLLELAFSTYDFSKHIDDCSLLFINDKKDEIAIAIGMFESAVVIENWNMVFDNYINKKLDVYAEYAQKTLDILNGVRCNVGTVMSVGNILADNDISNLPYVISSRGIDEIKDLFKGKPAVLVSTGPSFVKNVFWLRDIQDKVIIIAVAQALRPLLAYDIRPDFITTVDFGEPNMGHLKGMMELDVPMVCLNRTYAPLLKGYAGPKFIVSSVPIGYDATAAGVIAHKGTLEQGGSVAHMSLGLANHLGCNPIMLIGQDLALGETSHTRLADVAGQVVVKGNEILWDVKDQRSNLVGKSHSMGQVNSVPGYFGGQVLTNIGLASFINSFEVIASRFDKGRELINCTEGGADLRGFKKSSLKNALDKYCKDAIDKTILNKYLTDADNTDELIKKTIPLIKKDVSNLEHIISNSTKGLHSAEKLLKACEMDETPKRDEALKHWAARNHKYSKTAFDYTVMNPLVSVSIYAASRQIQSHAMNVTAKIEELNKDKDKLRTRIKRNQLILGAAKKASESLLVPYNKALEILRQYMKTKNKSLIREPLKEEIDLSDAEKYFENGNFAHPYVDAIRLLKGFPSNGPAMDIRDKAIEMRSKLIEEYKDMYQESNTILSYSESMKQSRESGKNKDYDNALFCLFEANKIKPCQEEVYWGLATTYHFMSNKEESKKWYNKLLEEFPESPYKNKYNFECGQVLLSEGNAQEGLRLIGKAMTSTGEFNYFYERLGALYEKSKLYNEAIIAYEEFNRFFPGRADIISKIEKLKNENSSNN